jgi:hypothetical protein
MKIEKEEKHNAKMKERQESEERWEAYCANQLKILKELNQEESGRITRRTGRSV